jgi:hypothetical protein
MKNYIVKNKNMSIEITLKNPDSIQFSKHATMEKEDRENEDCAYRKPGIDERL